MPKLYEIRRLLAAAFGTVLLFAVPAMATSNPVVHDCLQHRKGLPGHYTVARLNHALQVMPPATREYTSCPDVIDRALLATITATGPFLPVPVLVILSLLIVGAAGFGVQEAIRERRRTGRRPRE